MEVFSMGKEQRSGFGYGMDLRSAQRNMINSLEQTHHGFNGDDITEWISSKCLEEPIPATPANKTKCTKINPKSVGKLITGFIITNETPELIRKQISASYGFGEEPQVFETFALTQGDAKKKAEELALKHDMPIHVIPARLWVNEVTGKLSVPSHILEVSALNGKQEKPGKWSFEVEIRN
jgi:hypothetical protein